MLVGEEVEHLDGAAEGALDGGAAAARHVVFHRDLPVLRAGIEFACHQRHQVGGMGLVLQPVEDGGAGGLIFLGARQLAVGKDLPARGHGDQHFGGGLVVGKIVAREPIAVVAAGGVAIGPDLPRTVGMMLVGEDEEEAAPGLGVVVNHEIDGRAGRVGTVERDVELIVRGVEGRHAAGRGGALRCSDRRCRAPARARRP